MKMLTVNDLIPRNWGAILGASALMIGVLFAGGSAALASEGVDLEDEISVVMVFLTIGVISVTSIIVGMIRRRETEKTIQLAIEKGQALDVDVIERLLGSRQPSHSRIIIIGVVMISTGIGLGLLSFFVSDPGEPSPIMPLIGTGLLVGTIGAGFLVAARMVQRLGNGNEGSGSNL